MKIVDEKLTIAELKQMAAATFGNLVKAVVDVERELIAVDAELHSDLEAVLLEDGSKQKNIWVSIFIRICMVMSSSSLTH